MRSLEKIISFAKGRPVSLDQKVNIYYISGIFIEKSFALVRGLLKTRKFVFLGKGTSLRASRQFFPGKGVEISSFCQIDCLSHHGLHIGGGSKIGSYSILKVSGTLSDLGQKIDIGKNVGIGDFTQIGGAGLVYIGDNTICGSYLSIHPENHIFDKSSIPIRLQGVNRIGISIGSDCWIGAKVTFLDGSSVGNGCIVAAGAVVTKTFPDFTVIGGVPAKILKYRFM